MAPQVSAPIQHGTRKRREISGTIRVNRTSEGPPHSAMERPAARVNARYIRGSGLSHVQPSDRTADDHPLDLRGALEDREDPGGTPSGPSCTGRMLIIGQRHLRRVLAEHIEHYNTGRARRVLNLRAPADDRDVIPFPPHRIKRTPVLGGLINEHEAVP
jgi:hypothetical protein